MASFVWNRNPEEAYQEPYEYAAQEQFTYEAKRVLDGLFGELCKYSRKFSRDERTTKKAIWMLQLDATDSLRDCLDLLVKKRHRIASRVFRDVMETLDLAAYYNSNSKDKNKHLDDWYDNEIISHGICRDYIKKSLGKEASEEKKTFYRIISKITHRTYRTLAYGYILSRGDMLAYEGDCESDILIPVQTISMYYAILAHFIWMLSDEIEIAGLVPSKNIDRIWSQSIEKEAAPRHFITKREVYETYRQQRRLEQG